MNITNILDQIRNSAISEHDKFKLIANILEAILTNTNFIELDPHKLYVYNNMENKIKEVINRRP